MYNQFCIDRVYILAYIIICFLSHGVTLTLLWFTFYKTSVFGYTIFHKALYKILSTYCITLSFCPGIVYPKQSKEECYYWHQCIVRPTHTTNVHIHLHLRSILGSHIVVFFIKVHVFCILQPKVIRSIIFCHLNC